MSSPQAGGRVARRSTTPPARRLVRLPLGLAAALVAALLASCGPATLQVPAAASATPAFASTAVPRAEQVRFALIGKLNGGNVWATFDSSGYSYNDYAIRSAYWPRLYHLTIPDGRFEPMAASGLPSAVEREDQLFAATVRLRPDLKWSDGAPFTAGDVAFTVNTALAFQLGFDWHAYYDPAWLDHAQAVDATTVKFVFKQAPDVGVWQYGALQGPVVQEAYWKPKLVEASALLPSPESIAQIEVLNARVAGLQKSVQELVTAGFSATGEQARQLQVQLHNQQGDLDEARNDLAAAEASIEAALQGARSALYALGDKDEPALGPWMPAGNEGGAWANTADPAHAFGAPNFERATYSFYPDQAAAVAAVVQGKAEAVLDPRGLSPAARAAVGAGATLLANPTSSMRAVVVNPTKPELADPALRRALFCAISRTALAEAVDAMPLASLVSPDDPLWWNPAGAVDCGSGYDPLLGPDQPYQAAAVLKAAGYTWAQEPAAGRAGSGLLQPGGIALRPFGLLAPDAASDPQAAAAAQLVESSARALGIPLTVQPADPVAIRFAVFNGHDYDFALVGWRLSAYPGYLCDWFGSDNPLGYRNPQLASECAALRSTSDLEAARSRIFNIQSLLAANPPILPIFSGKTYEISRSIVYPFDRVLNGLSGMYGAPSQALPSAPPK